MKITTVSNKLLAILEEFEHFSAKPYLCPSGVPTIGFGTTFYFDTKKFVTMEDKPILIKEARRLKLGHLNAVFCPLADRLCRDNLTQNEFDAIVSFLYNTGGMYTDLRGVRHYYDLFKHVNNLMNHKDLSLYWQKCAIRGNGKILNGLIRRRKREALIYTKNEY